MESGAGTVMRLGGLRASASQRRGMPPQSGRVVGSAEGSTPSWHNRAQQRAQLTAHQSNGTTIRADVASH